MARIAEVGKAGHAGTLDPMASGLVIVLFGNATKISAFLTGLEKAYFGEITLGVTTTTGDMEGEIISKIAPVIEENRLFEIVNEIIKLEAQIPPVFSAIKHNGKPLYRFARRGEKVRIEPRNIRIIDFSIEKIELPKFRFKIIASKGTSSALKVLRSRS